MRLITIPSLSDDIDTGDDSGIDWTSVINTGIGAAGSILSHVKTPVSTPVSTTTRVITTTPLSASAGIPTWAILGAAAVGAVLLLKK